jgi:glyoxylase-like metal-dependent hydrolase (beta-lactamase superfamily II)
MTELNRRVLLTGAAAASAATAFTPLATLPASAAAPLAGKQNPGWYRYKVGDFEVTVVTDGRNNNPLPDTYAANAKKDEVNGALVANRYPADRAVQTYTPVVINTGSKLVVIDTGLGLGVFNQSKGALGQFRGNLIASGIEPSQVDVVLISHLHGDHYGGLIDTESKPVYPNAEVMVPEAELKFWSDESNASKAPEILKGNFANVKRVFGALGSKVTQHAPDKELVPGIRAVSTPGHTPAHTSHLVTSGSDKVLVQADITAGMAFLFVQHPDWQLAFDSDKQLAVQTRKKIYDMAVADKMMVQGFHFTFPGNGYVEKAGNGYRIIPAPWNSSI